MNEVAAFVRSLPLAAEELIAWPGGFELELRTYITGRQPPSQLITSGRAVVLQDTKVLVVTDRSPSTHVLPGGRMEAGEGPDGAAVREIAEESGWEVELGPQIGVRHLRHLNPRPPGFALPYPDFFQVVYVATAVRYSPHLRDPQGWETEARFIPAEAAEALKLGSGERALLLAALAATWRALPPTSI